MKHILNDLTEQEKNAIREQHAGGMKVMTENFSKLLNSKLGDVKPVSEQTTNVVNNASIGGVIGGVVGGLVSAADAIANGSGTSDQKVKQFCDLCRKSKSQITQNSNRLADMIRDAVQGVGTDENSIYKAFNSLRTFDEFCGLVTAYRQSYNTELYTDLDSDIDSESEWVAIFRPIRNVLLKQQQSVQKTVGTQRTNPQTVGNPVKPTGGVLQQRQQQRQQQMKAGQRADGLPQGDPRKG